MTTPKKGQEKTRPEPKKPAGIKAEINKGKAELSDDELKTVTGGATSRKTFTLIE
jgi:bacteriocin-like protein